MGWCQRPAAPRKATTRSALNLVDEDSAVEMVEWLHQLDTSAETGTMGRPAVMVRLPAHALSEAKNFRIVDTE